MALIANGDTGVRRTMASSLVISAFLAILCGQTYASTENIAFFYLAAILGVFAYQMLVRCGSALLLNDMTAPASQNQQTHIVNVVLSLGSIAGGIWFGYWPLFIGLSIVAVIVEVLFLVANR